MPNARLALVAIISALLLGDARPSDAGGVGNGLAVAVSADGKQLVAGSANTRALYELDPATLKVRRRVHLGWRVQAMAFAPDGKTILVECTKAFHWVDASTLKPKKTLESGDNLSIAHAAGLVALNVKKRPYSIKIFDVNTGEEKTAIAYNSRQSVAGFGLSPDGKRLALLHSRTADKSEKKVPFKEIPEELRKKRGPELEEFKLRNDGYTSQFLVYDVATGKPTLDTRIWYGTSNLGHLVAWHGDTVHVVTYDNKCVKIDAKGEATFFELGNSYNYAKAASADGSVLLSGGLRNGSRTAAASLESTEFSLDKIVGFPEYFFGFSFAADGTGYGGTTAHRVVRIKSDGTVEAATPVF